MGSEETWVKVWVQGQYWSCWYTCIAECNLIQYVSIHGLLGYCTTYQEYCLCRLSHTSTGHLKHSCFRSLILTFCSALHFYLNYVTFRCMLSQRCLLSVCNIRAPCSAGGNFPQCLCAILYLSFSHLLTSMQNFRRSSQGNPSVGDKNARGVVAKYSDFGPVKGYISETVQDMMWVTVNH